MKNLYLLRHAKSSWDDPSLSDAERPLNGRGRRDAPRMGAALGARLPPMTFHVSPAERAQQTFGALQQSWAGLEVHHGITEPTLYTFDYREVLRWIAAQPDDTDSLALVGHNPAFTELVNFLSVRVRWTISLRPAGQSSRSASMSGRRRPMPRGRARSFITSFPSLWLKAMGATD